MHNSFCSRGRFLICWLSGLLLGVLAAAQAEPECISLMRLSLADRVSIVTLLRCLLPFLIAAVAVMIQQWKLLPVLAFLRCFCFGFFLWLSVAAFGSGAWLAVPLFCFPELVSLWAFCWLGFQEPARSRRIFWLCIILIFAAVIADHWFASPLRAMLLHY